VVDGHRAGDDHAVGGDDLAPGLGVVPHHRPDVAGVVGQAVGLDDLEVVELDEEGQEADDDGDADPADLTVHWAHRCVRAAGAPTSASERRATSSEIRSSSARITKLATSDDPP